MFIEILVKLNEKFQPTVGENFLTPFNIQSNFLINAIYDSDSYRMYGLL